MSSTQFTYILITGLVYTVSPCFCCLHNTLVPLCEAGTSPILYLRKYIRSVSGILALQPKYTFSSASKVEIPDFIEIGIFTVTGESVLGSLVHWS